MSPTPDDRFCGHCGERLPPFGGRLGYCARCARRYRSAVNGQRSFVRDWRRMPKDPLAATVLSVLLPGGGQLYNGHFLKAVIFFVTAPLVIPWAIGIADAFFSARRINVTSAMSDVSDRSDRNDARAQPGMQPA